MISKTFTKRALMGLGAGAMALGALSSTGCMREANAADNAAPSKIEQVSGYSYSQALAMSQNGVVLYAANDIDGADHISDHIASETNIPSTVVFGLDQPESVRLLILGEDLGVYDQDDGVDGGMIWADAVKYIRQIEPRRLSALAPAPAN